MVFMLKMLKTLEELLSDFDGMEVGVEELIDSETLERYAGRILKALKPFLENPYMAMQVANDLRRESCGEIVTFVVNRNVNFTDFCINSCRFCSFRNRKKYVLSQEEIEEKVREAIQSGCTEVCLQGGLIANADLEFYVSILRAVRRVSKKIHIHAFSPMEILHASRNSGCSVEEAIKELKKSGLNSIPGTAAEIFDSSVRSEICPEKLTSREWFKVVKAAHELGLPSTATMMYGHVESWKERVAHMLALRKLQLETNGFTEFIPLTFLWKNNELGKKVKGCSGFEDLVVTAISRILLNDVIKNLQASWVKLGVKLAQAALFAGANDLGGTLMEENISRAAGTSGECLSVEELVELIRRCNRTPAERDTLYRLIKIY